MKRRLLALFLALAMIFTVTACSDTSTDDTSTGNSNQTGDSQPSDDGTSTAVDTVKLGAIYPLTGSAAKTGKEYIDAVQLAVDIINGSYDLDLPFAQEEGIPGLGGAKIELITADHQASPELGLSETERLITNEGVHLVMGAHYSSVAKTASNAAERLGIPFVIPDATSPDLTERGFEWVFRTGPHDKTFVSDTFSYLQMLNDEYDAGIKTVAMVAEDTEFGALLAQATEEMYADYGFELVENITYPANATNVTSEVIKLKEANADALIMASYTSDAILFIKTFAEQNYVPKAIVGQRAGFIAPELFDALGDLCEGLATTNIFSLDLANSNPMIAEVNELYKERSGVDFTGDYARAFTAVFVIADALDRAGSVEPEAIRQALRETDIVNDEDFQLILPWEGVKFDEKGQNIYATGIVTQFIDGQYQTVWPEANKAIDPVVPLTGWN